ncbi:MAG: ATP-binding cassette domain-containing protein [Rubrobacteridae bacterium]|nr:ATP-binding cassette domain-containing protein [Rubrobacteridae bacterium]
MSNPNIPLPALDSINTINKKVVEAEKLTKLYDGLTAVNSISFDITRGERFGLLGPNGAGKTTAIKMLFGMTPPSSGSLSLFGLDITQRTREIKQRIGVVPQETNLDTDLTVIENLEVYANYFGITKHKARAKALELLRFVHLEERLNTMVDDLSGGMKRRLLIARALLNDPELIILDEPTTGLDPQARHLIWDRLKSLRQQQVTIVITTHYMDEASQLCNRLIIMDEGKIIAEGTPDKLIDKYVSREVLEISPGYVASDEIVKLLGPLSDGYETQDKLLIFYSRSADTLLKTVKEARLDIESASLRRSGLEDVFLKLTGRRLRD